MPVIDINKRLGKVRNRVEKLGLEMEGGWARQLRPPDRLGHDGSVFDRGNNGQRRHVFPPGMPENAFAGEAVSSPLDPINYPRWIRRCYPTWHDDTCGLHVHMSFTSVKYYEILASSVDYYDTMMQYLKLWALEEDAKAPGLFPEDHHIWSRLAGTNRYCLGKWWPEKQIHRTTKPVGRNAVRDDEVGHRYTAINFPFAIHKTIEIRVLPMFPDADMAIRAVRRTIDITNACLVVMAKKLEPVVEEVILLPDNLYEEVDQEVL
jgi:hypothetical protein